MNPPATTPDVGPAVHVAEQVKTPRQMNTNMTVINPDGTETFYPSSSTIAQAYRALNTAAERMGRNNAPQYMHSAEMNRLPGVRYGNKKAGRGAYSITAAHCEIIEAMPALLAGKITPEEAMALLHGYDVMQQRIA